MLERESEQDEMAFQMFLRLVLRNLPANFDPQISVPLTEVFAGISAFSRSESSVKRFDFPFPFTYSIGFFNSKIVALCRCFIVKPGGLVGFQSFVREGRDLCTTLVGKSQNKSDRFTSIFLVLCVRHYSHPTIFIAAA